MNRTYPNLVKPKRKRLYTSLCFSILSYKGSYIT